jgi:hypothetical protein
MSKRKSPIFLRSTNAVSSPKRKKSKFESLPPIKNLDDLIKIGLSNKFYKNIDIFTLWEILPYLQELNEMIGMKSLKESVFYQVIYYLQNMHIKNKDGDYLHTIITGKPGTGKCMAYDTPILMFDGTIKKIQNIVVGDQLMGDDSTVRNVLSLARGREQMFKITQNKGMEYTVNKSHILSLKVSRIRNKKTNTLEIKGKQYKKNEIIDIPLVDYLELPKTYQLDLKGFKVAVDFPSINVTFNPYILGYILSNCQFYNEITIPHANIFEYISNQFNAYNMGLELMQIQGTQNKYKIVTTDNQNKYMKILYYLDIEKKREIPDLYRINDKNVRLQLLGGIIDNSGTINTNCYEIVEKNNKFAEDIVFLAQSLGFYTSITKFEKQNTYVYNRIIISGNVHTIPVLSKEIKERSHIKNVLHTGIKVTELGEDNYYGFTLDGNSRYLLSDFTVTHNTTVAKIISKIYSNLGVLSNKNIFKVAHREDFVGEYLGSTANKTKKLLNSCLGGVLFVDEVYALGPGQKDKDSYSKEAIDTICAFLSENKVNFCFICAGYKEQIEKCFLSVNEGLRRRFQWIHHIEDYSNEDLHAIFIKMIKETNWTLQVDKEILLKIIENNKDIFVDAGGSIEGLITKIKLVHSKRVFGLENEYKFIILEEDILTAIEMMKRNNMERLKKVNYDYYT